MENITVREEGKLTEERKPLQKPGSMNGVKAVMFLPFTPFGGLNDDLRRAEYQLENLTGYRLKLVERSGLKLEDLLTTNNP